MNHNETAALLAMAAAFDNRKPDTAALSAWQAALDDLRFEDCRQALIDYYKHTREWLMPSDIREGVGSIRRGRLNAAGAFALTPPDGMDPDAGMRWLAEARTAIADGQPVPTPPALASGR